MLHSAAARWIVGTVVVIAVLGVLRFKPWRGAATVADSASPRQQLKVGFLPVT